MGWLSKARPLLLFFFLTLVLSSSKGQSSEADDNLSENFTYNGGYPGEADENTSGSATESTETDSDWETEPSYSTSYSKHKTYTYDVPENEETEEGTTGNDEITDETDETDGTQSRGRSQRTTESEDTDETRDDNKLIQDQEISNYKDTKKTYKTKYNFLKDLKYEEALTPINKKQFFKYFKIELKSRSIFLFIKYCYHIPEMPKYHNNAIKKCLIKIAKNKYSKIPDDLYDEYDREGDVGETDTSDETDDQEISNYKDTKKTYKTKYNFLKDLKYEDALTPINKKQFFVYFKIGLKSRSIFDFLKYCFHIPEMPKYHNNAIKKCLIKIAKNKYSNIPDDLYDEYDREGDIDETDTSDETDDQEISNYKDTKKTYKTKHNFLKDLKYEDALTRINKKQFFVYFKIGLKSRSIFDFLKYCFHIPEMPKYHNNAIKQCLIKIAKNKYSEIPDDLYYEYDHRVAARETDTLDTTDEPVKKKPGSLNSESDDKLPYFNDDKNLYFQKHKFLKELHDKDIFKKRIQRKFYVLFNWKIQSRSFLRFLQYCYRRPKMPEHHNSTLNEILIKYNISRYSKVPKHLNEIYDNGVGIYYSDDDGNISSNRRKPQRSHNDLAFLIDLPDIFDNANSYSVKYNFLKDLTYDAVLKRKYHSKFFSLFNFNITSRTLFRSLKHCYRYPNIPRKHTRALKDCLRKYGIPEHDENGY